MVARAGAKPFETVQKGSRKFPFRFLFLPFDFPFLPFLVFLRGSFRLALREFKGLGGISPLSEIFRDAPSLFNAGDRERIVAQLDGVKILFRRSYLATI